MPRLRKLAPLATVIALSIVLLTACGNPSTQQSSGDETPAVDSITIAAASDLRPAFEELAPVFTEATNINVTYSFGSSGQLREQIKNGAPFDVFASANTDFVEDVIAAGKAIESTKTAYAVGRIVLWAASGTSAPQSLTDLTSSQYRTIVIANPSHAPYGIAAQQAMQSAGVWDQLQSRLVYGENISDAMQILKSGNADVGIIALSLALANDASYVLIPDSLHQPLLQSIVVTTKGARTAAAQQFIDFLISDRGQEIMNKYGFVAP